MFHSITAPVRSATPFNRGWVPCPLGNQPPLIESKPSISLSGTPPLVRRAMLPPNFAFIGRTDETLLISDPAAGVGVTGSVIGKH